MLKWMLYRVALIAFWDRSRFRFADQGARLRPS